MQTPRSFLPLPVTTPDIWPVFAAAAALSPLPLALASNRRQVVARDFIAAVVAGSIMLGT